MFYKFDSILVEDIYLRSRVFIAVGKYSIFNNMAVDTLKGFLHGSSAVNSDAVALVDDFGIEEDSTSGNGINSVTLEQFLELVYTPSVIGKWYCQIDWGYLSKKNKERVLKYFKDPNENGVLVITSTDWKVYRELLNNKVIRQSMKTNLLQLSFPDRKTLKAVVKQLFESKNIMLDNGALELFINRMSSAYDKYEETIEKIAEGFGDKHSDVAVKASDMKVYMKGIENFVLDDFIRALTKPLNSAKSNKKKVLSIMVMLEEEMGAYELVRQTLIRVNELIDYRLLINKGCIPIGLKFFFKEVVNNLPDPEKYQKVNEYTFRRKASLASETSLQDWVYMRMILLGAIENRRVSDEVLEFRCKKALYSLCNRTILTENRINNDIKISNILEQELYRLDACKL